jgi:hypothetical protein
MSIANEKLVELLNETSKAFMTHDFDAVSSLFRSDFRFKLYFERDGKRFVSKGGLEEFLSSYKNIAEGEGRYTYWNYDIIHCSRTIFGKIKATLLFRSVLERPDNSKQETINVEKIVCVLENGKAKLQNLEIDIGKVNT